MKCAARQRKYNLRCKFDAANGELCHLHAAMEDRGKYVPRYKIPRTKAAPAPPAPSPTDSDTTTSKESTT